MSVVSIINRNFLKTAVSVRCLSWHSNYVQCPADQTVNRQHICQTKKLSAVTSSSGFQCRFKYNKSNSKKGKDEEDDDDDDDSTSAAADFYEAGDTKLATVRVGSLRMDLIVKSGLKMARNKVEAAFFDSKIRLNGKKVLKKSVTLRLGDEVDVVKGFSPVNKEHLIVSRLEIIKATANEEDISVAVRRYKSLTIENYSGSNAYKESVVTDQPA